MSNEIQNLRHELQAMARSRDQMNVKIARLTNERDEARAAVAALREAMQAALTKILERIAASGRLYDLEARSARVVVGEILDNALSQPNPGAALLDRLKAAEDVVDAAKRARAYQLRGAPANGAVLMGSEERDLDIALAAWRNLTGDPQ